MKGELRHQPGCSPDETTRALAAGEYHILILDDNYTVMIQIMKWMATSLATQRLPLVVSMVQVWTSCAALNEAIYALEDLGVSFRST